MVNRAVVCFTYFCSSCLAVTLACVKAKFMLFFVFFFFLYVNNPKLVLGMVKGFM